jgi:hypothetical protein
MWSKYCIRKGKLFNLAVILRTNDVTVYFACIYMLTDNNLSNNKFPRIWRLTE